MSVNAGEMSFPAQSMTWRARAVILGATLAMTAGECMVRTPQTIGPQVLASEALNLMEKKKITSVVVVDGEHKVLGVLHLHDLWTLELI